METLLGGRVRALCILVSSAVPGIWYHSEVLTEHLLWARPWNTMGSITVGTSGNPKRGQGSLFVLDAKKMWRLASLHPQASSNCGLPMYHWGVTLEYCQC